MKYHFRDRWHVKPLMWIMPVNSNSGLEHAVDLHKVCASVAHQQAEAAVCIFICQELLGVIRNDQKFHSRVTTRDETWVYCYDPETKQQSSQWKSPSLPCPKKVRQVRSNMKSMSVFFPCEGIVHQEFVILGQMVNQHYYQEVLQRLR
jgi:hypothetical protein